jgi:hypothetical protein
VRRAAVKKLTQVKASLSPNDQTQASNLYYERDNLGTRYDSHDKVLDYWEKYIFGKPNDPHIFYDMPSEQDAVNAMLSLPPFKLAADSGKIISTEVLQFGVFDKSEVYGEPIWGFFLAGKQITLELFNLATVSCQKYNGSNAKLISPPQEASNNILELYDNDTDNVEFDSKQEIDVLGIVAVRVFYKARTKKSALEFLKNTDVNKGLYYIIVSTPDGFFGKDINGIYEVAD